MKQALFYFSFLLLPVASFAKIKYTNVNPDTIITATVAQGFSEFDMDMDKDGTVDFYIKHFHPSASQQEAEFYTKAGGTGEVLVDGGNHPLALGANEKINATATAWVNMAGPAWSTALMMAPTWSGKEDHYVGVRLKINNKWHYGWVKLSIPVDISQITVKEYALNETADSPINAGQVYPTAINDVTAPAVPVLYPNPIVTQAMMENPTSNGMLVIYNQQGAIVKRMDNLREKQITISRDGLPAGIYYFELSGDDNRVTKGKLAISDR